MGNNDNPVKMIPGKDYGSKPVRFDDRMFRSTNEALIYALMKILQFGFDYEKWNTKIYGWWADLFIWRIPGMPDFVLPSCAEVKSVDDFAHKYFNEAKDAILDAMRLGHHVFDDGCKRLLFKFGRFPWHVKYSPSQPIAAISSPTMNDKEYIPLTFGINYDSKNLISLKDADTEDHFGWKPITTDLEIKAVKGILKDAEDWVKLDRDREFITFHKVSKMYKEHYDPILRAAHAGVDLELRYCERTPNMDVKSKIIMYDTREDLEKRLGTQKGLLNHFFGNDVDHQEVKSEMVK